MRFKSIPTPSHLILGLFICAEWLFCPGGVTWRGTAWPNLNLHRWWNSVKEIKSYTIPLRYKMDILVALLSDLKSPLMSEKSVKLFFDSFFRSEVGGELCRETVFADTNFHLLKYLPIWKKTRTNKSQFNKWTIWQMK